MDWNEFFLKAGRFSSRKFVFVCLNMAKDHLLFPNDNEAISIVDDPRQSFRQKNGRLPDIETADNVTEKTSIKIDDIEWESIVR